jgi:uncharacterized DUF497 family protein
MGHGMAAFLYEFEWDPVKAQANLRKHGVEFERAAQVFGDPLALTILDEEHSENEVRWVTLRRDMSGRCLLVVHTFDQLTDERGRIRVISARQPTKTEVRSYEEEP